ncbi:MAG TPA: hypothetical protein VHD32_18585 [Candidatus Didemnitutus sp.]|nr:hypothetical protein [Candidatus Didemnitutus sp.]
MFRSIRLARVVRSLPPLAGFLLAVSGALAAELPGYVGPAFARFNPDPPAGWAFTATVVRGTDTIVESFDPSRAAGKKWLLEKVNGHVPTAGESDKYSRYRETMDSAATARATFTRGDVDFGNIRDVSSESAKVTFRCGFRAEAPDPVLAHLGLVVTAASDPGRIVHTTLHLISPFSPILGVTMKSLTVETSYATPPGESVEMPAVRTSRFTGRVFWFWSIDEIVETRYSGFHRVTGPSARP